MSHARRRFSNPTLPKRCNALVGDSPAGRLVCLKRVVKAGLCGEHYTDGQKAREERRKTVTRRRLGIDDRGKMAYGTIEESDEIHFCHVTKCQRLPIININDVLYCEKCFTKEQRRLQRNQNKTSPVLVEN